MEGVQLIGDHHLHFAGGRGRVQLCRGFRRGAKLGAPMHDIQLRGDIPERQRPIHGEIPAAGDHDAAAAEILAPAYVVLHGPARLVCLEPVQRRPVGAERAGAGGDHHGARADGVALVGAQSEGTGLAFQCVDPAVQQARGVERGDLRFQLGDQMTRGQ